MKVSDESSMTSIKEVAIINSNTVEARALSYGFERALCGPEIGSKTLSVYWRTVLPGQQFQLQAGENYHLVYVIEDPTNGALLYRDEAHDAQAGAGVLLAPGESVEFQASPQSNIDLLHMIVSKPPAEVEGGLPGGPGYYFDRQALRVLKDASGGRLRRFCAESSVRLMDGTRLTPTNAIQAGEMHYVEGGSSPYHSHAGTSANPRGADHCYITFNGRALVEVEDSFREIEVGTLVYLPPGAPHRLSALDGPLDYFEVQAWRSFKTNILSEEPLGLRWYYEPESADADPIEWNQS